ncbi:MEKK1a [Symbiodinium necroappetens]|uniref:MEKK1a protein n=1 Tax=Symbiodinium necroappetens TaxID=1628268 RepID=A0A813BW75_9DINO|nr:MEKK1a [Symbiodinium necroappetens]
MHDRRMPQNRPSVQIVCQFQEQPRKYAAQRSLSPARNLSTRAQGIPQQSAAFWRQVRQQAEFIWHGDAGNCPPGPQVRICLATPLVHCGKASGESHHVLQPSGVRRSQSVGGTPRGAHDPARCQLRAPPPCISIAGGISSGTYHPPKLAWPLRPVHASSGSQPSYAPRQGQLQAPDQAKPVSLRARSCDGIPRWVSQRPVELTQPSTALLRSSSDRRPLATASEKPKQGQGRCHSAPVLRLRQAEPPSPRPRPGKTTAPRRGPCVVQRILRLPSPRLRPPLPSYNHPNPKPKEAQAAEAAQPTALGPGRPGPRSPKAGPRVHTHTAHASHTSRTSRTPGTQLTPTNTAAFLPHGRVGSGPGTRLHTPSPKGCREPTEGQNPFGSPRVLEVSEIQKTVHIGSGSFGSVWKATVRGYPVAVKICQQNTANERRVTLKELGFLCNLHHQRLVSFLGFAQTADQLIFVMELMTGGNLSDLLFCKRPVLSFRQKALMGCQVAEGLSFLHERHVIHRDLKTMNVVLDASLNCKLCDFGLTLYLDHTHITVCGLQGSPRYMAPEQLETTVRISEKVDIWQMGCVMLELFCTVVPFSSLSNVAAIISELIVKKNGPTIPDDADPRARALILPCLRMSPRSRPAADTLLDVLGRVVSSGSTAVAK